MRLDLGSGRTYRKGYFRVDSDPSTYPDLCTDIRDLSKLKSNSADEILSSHSFEHIPPQHSYVTLLEWKRVLKPGGKLSIVVPDVGTTAELWVKGKLHDCCFTKAVLGGYPSSTPQNIHQNIFWYSKLYRLLFVTGFINIHGKKNFSKMQLEFLSYKPKGVYNVKRKSSPGNR